MTLQEIKQKIEALSLEELIELEQYAAELQAQRRDEQAAFDVAPEELDTLVARAEADLAAGRTMSLEESEARMRDYKAQVRAREGNVNGNG